VRVFVTGASGFIGSAVVAELTRAHHHVIGLARSPASAARLSALGAEVAEGSISDLDRLHARAAASDGVIHLAYRHGDPPEVAAEADRAAIEMLGDALAGSGRPLVATSGTLVLPAGRTGTEDDVADPAAPAAARVPGERAALAAAGRGVRASVVRLAPCVHERERRGFAGALIDSAIRAGVAGYLGDGSQRWPALHRQDAARLYRLALEDAPAGSVLHGVGEQGVTLRSVAELVGAKLGLPVRPVPDKEKAAYFGWLAGLAGTDAPASSIVTQALLSWRPTHPGLLDDLEHGCFFGEAQR
jgi:nucleoside-diphosphate-sugar epimerase